MPFKNILLLKSVVAQANPFKTFVKTKDDDTMYEANIL